MPAYNSEKFIVESLESLVNQSFRDFELIVIDDGSADSTAEIAGEYCAKYPFIKLIKKENGGVSSARNAGLDAAQGKYTAFLDSDDMFSPDFLGAMYDTAEKSGADLVIGKIRNFSDLGFSSYQERAKSLAEKGETEAFDKEILWNFLLGNKLFLRSKIEELALRFPKLNYSEDGVFLMDYVFASEKIVGCESACLNYRRNIGGDESLSRRVSEKGLADFLAAHEHIYHSAEKCARISGDDKKGYLEEIAYKTCFALLGQFYRRFWFAPENCLAAIRAAFEKWYPLAGEENIERLKNQNTDLNLKNLTVSHEEMKKKPLVSVIVYDNNCPAQENAAFFSSLFNQSMPAIEVIAPRSMLENGNLPIKWLNMGNLTALHGDGYARVAKKKAKASCTVTFKKPAVLKEGLLRAVYRSKKVHIFGDRLFSLAVHTVIYLGGRKK